MKANLRNPRNMWSPKYTCTAQGPEKYKRFVVYRRRSTYSVCVFLILRQNPILKLINFQNCVTRGSLCFYCCITFLLKNVGGGAAGGLGCTTHLCTVKPRPPSVVVASIASGGCGLGGYTSAGAGTQQGHEELYASMQQTHDELYIQAHKNDTRSF